jgi:hypothetical protein
MTLRVNRPVAYTIAWTLTDGEGTPYPGELPSEQETGIHHLLRFGETRGELRVWEDGRTYKGSWEARPEEKEGGNG